MRLFELAVVCLCAASSTAFTQGTTGEALAPTLQALRGAVTTGRSLDKARPITTGRGAPPALAADGAATY